MVSKLVPLTLSSRSYLEDLGVSNESHLLFRAIFLDVLENLFCFFSFLFVFKCFSSKNNVHMEGQPSFFMCFYYLGEALVGLLLGSVRADLGLGEGLKLRGFLDFLMVGRCSYG